MKDEIFKTITIGNSFYIEGENFIKWNKTQATGNNVQLVNIDDEQPVRVYPDLDRQMCA